MIDADKILAALSTDPGGALREWGGRARDAGGAMMERIATDPQARNAAMIGAGGALAGLLAGTNAPRLTGALLRVGALAALGGLAYHAWQRREADRRGVPAPPVQIAPPPSGFLPRADSADGQRLARLTLKAMINAAKADGAIDSEEKARLFDRLGQVSLSPAEQAFLFEELARPMDTEGLVAEADTPALAAHVYAASLLGLGSESLAEKAYLEDLAARLRLDADLVMEIRAAA